MSVVRVGRKRVVSVWSERMSVRQGRRVSGVIVSRARKRERGGGRVGQQRGD